MERYAGWDRCNDRGQCRRYVKMVKKNVDNCRKCIHIQDYTDICGFNKDMLGLKSANGRYSCIHFLALAFCCGSEVCFRSGVGISSYQPVDIDLLLKNFRAADVSK